MTKRDYQAIARAIHKTKQEQYQLVEVAGEPFDTLGVISERLADILAQDNPRFDRALFIEACETGKCKGMPR